MATPGFPPGAPSNNKRQRADVGPVSRNAATGNEGDTARRGLVSVNNLRYELPADLSVVVSRTNQNHFFHQLSYSMGQRAVCILNSGAAYVDPKNSYLVFDLEVKSPLVDETHSFGSGSVANLFRHVSIVSRSGDEIETFGYMHNLMPYLDKMEHNSDWFETTGSMMGYAAPHGAATNSQNEMKTGAGGVVTKRFVIPLSCMSAFFRSTDKLIPAALASGLRFEFELADMKTVLKSAAGKLVTDIFLKNMRIVADSYQLTDSIQRGMNETIAADGLEMPYTAFHNTPFNTTDALVNIEIRKAVSRALQVYSILQVRADLTNQLVDSFESAQKGMISYQARVGSLYFR